MAANSNTHGGARAGAGRKPRARIIRETAVDVVLARRAAGGREPLQVMLDAMDETYEAQGAIAAFPFAQACAPYMHAKLGNIEVRANTDTIADLAQALRYNVAQAGD